MCRLLVYKGTEPIQISHLVTRPRHSIINQAFESKLRMPSSRPLNADGFGIGWYDPLPAIPASAAPRPATSPVPSSTPCTCHNVVTAQASHSQAYDVQGNYPVDADGHMDENTLEVMKEREVERELEK